MCKKLSLFLVLFCFLATFGFAELTWIYEPEKAFAAAQQTGKPIFTDVFTTWCSWCKKLDQETFTHPDFLAIAPKFVLLKVDGDKYPDFKKKYGVPGYPTMLFLNGEGKEIYQKVVGFVTAAELVPIMKKVLIQPTAGIADLQWYLVPDEAFKTAQAQNKPVFVDVFTTWCSWCKKLDQETFTAPKFQNEALRFVLLKVDGDKYRDFVLKYSVKGYPTMLFLNGAGEEIHARVIGFVPADQLVPTMQEVK